MKENLRLAVAVSAVFQSDGMRYGVRKRNVPEATLGPDGKILQHEPQPDVFVHVCQGVGADAAAADEVARVVA